MNTMLRQALRHSPSRRAAGWFGRSIHAPSQCTYEGELSERTLVAFKPDTLQRALLGTLTQRLEQRGLKLVALKMIRPSRALAEQHYADHRDKPFFERACVPTQYTRITKCNYTTNPGTQNRSLACFFDELVKQTLFLSEPGLR